MSSLQGCVVYSMHLHVHASTEQSICGTFPCILLLCLFSGAYTFHRASTHTGQRWSVPTISQLSWPPLSLLGHLSLRVQLLPLFMTVWAEPANAYT